MLKSNRHSTTDTKDAFVWIILLIPAARINGVDDGE
jgi:hypothetical protein